LLATSYNPSKLEKRGFTMRWIVAGNVCQARALPVAPALAAALSAAVARHTLGPVRGCSPRHRMALKSRNEGWTCVLMAWQAIYARSYHASVAELAAAAAAAAAVAAAAATALATLGAATRRRQESIDVVAIRRLGRRHRRRRGARGPLAPRRVHPRPPGAHTRSLRSLTSGPSGHITHVRAQLEHLRDTSTG
jgi:hypothetical protein